jgi:hypothetical protein
MLSGWSLLARAASPRPFNIAKNRQACLPYIAHTRKYIRVGQLPELTDSYGSTGTNALSAVGISC